MRRELERLVKNESGAALVEWIIVTVILILATFAILQLIGDDLKAWYHTIWETIRELISGRAYGRGLPVAGFRATIRPWL